MSKRKPAMETKKHARSQKIAARAQRATQAFIKSPKVRRRPVALDSAESSPDRHNDPKPAVPVIENPVTVTDNGLRKGFDLFSTTANVRAYQAKLLEIAQANTTFAFEFSQRLATIRSPVEFLNVFAEFTSKRMAMFGKYSKEMVELSTRPTG
jgi:hypothetical protein